MRIALLPVRVKECTQTRSLRSTFFHPDYTVGSGVTPDPAQNNALVGFTTDRELRSPSHPAPKVVQARSINLARLIMMIVIIITYTIYRVNEYCLKTRAIKCWTNIPTSCRISFRDYGTKDFWRIFWQTLSLRSNATSRTRNAAYATAFTVEVPVLL